MKIKTGQCYKTVHKQTTFSKAIFAFHKIDAFKFSRWLSTLPFSIRHVFTKPKPPAILVQFTKNPATNQALN